MNAEINGRIFGQSATRAFSTPSHLILRTSSHSRWLFWRSWLRTELCSSCSSLKVPPVDLLSLPRFKLSRAPGKDKGRTSCRKIVPYTLEDNISLGSSVDVRTYSPATETTVPRLKIGGMCLASCLRSIPQASRTSIATMQVKNTATGVPFLSHPRPPHRATEGRRTCGCLNVWISPLTLSPFSPLGPFLSAYTNQRSPLHPSGSMEFPLTSRFPSAVPRAQEFTSQPIPTTPFVQGEFDSTNWHPPPPTL